MATPWESGSGYAASPERAAQTHRLVAPLQGSIAGGRRNPRALPWADLWLPLRGVGQECATSKRASEGTGWASATVLGQRPSLARRARMGTASVRTILS